MGHRGDGRSGPIRGRYRRPRGRLGALARGVLAAASASAIAAAIALPPVLTSSADDSAAGRHGSGSRAVVLPLSGDSDDPAAANEQRGFPFPGTTATASATQSPPPDDEPDEEPGETPGTEPPDDPSDDPTDRPTDEPTDEPTEDPLPGATTLFGTSLDISQDGGFNGWVRDADRTFGDLPVVRLFHSGLPTAWASTSELTNRTVVVSFKADPGDVVAGKHDDQLREWFASAPSTTVYWSYFHEPEDDIERGDFSAAQYREAWQHVDELADSAQRSNLHATLTLMGWSANPNSGRNWRDYYAGDDVIDVLAWDQYNFGHQNDRYTDPADLFDPLVEASREVGKPWGIGEIGSVVIDGDDGTQRAAWLNEAGSYLAAQDARFVTYFNTDVGVDYRLTDQPSRSAWSAFVTGS